MKTTCEELTSNYGALHSESPSTATPEEGIDMTQRNVTRAAFVAAIMREGRPLGTGAIAASPEVAALKMKLESISSELKKASDAGILVREPDAAAAQYTSQVRYVYDVPGRADAAKKAARVRRTEPEVEEARSVTKRKPRRAPEEMPRRKHHKAGRARLEAIVQFARENPGMEATHFVSAIAAKLGGHRTYYSTLYNELLRDGVLVRDGGPRIGKVFVKAELEKAAKRAEAEAKALAKQQAQQQADNAPATPESTPSTYLQHAPAPAAMSTTYSPPPASVAAATPGATFPHLAAQLADGLQGMAAQVADTLAIMIAQRVADAVTNILSTMPPQALQNVPLPEYTPPAPPAPKQKKTRVLVLGLLPSQAGQINAEFPQFDFDFVTADEMQRANKKVDNMDRVLSMTNFMSHALEEQVKHHAGYTRVSGGMSSLRQALRNLMQ